jgi:hypothetical protein
MKTIVLIGDSHVQGLHSAWSELVRLKESKFDIEIIQYSGKSAYSVDFSDIDLESLKDKIILIYFGENDIRRRLPKHDNAKDVVDIYVKKALKYFKGNRVIFVQPPPQALDHLTHEFNHTNELMKGFVPYTIKERLEQQTNFYRALEEFDGIELIRMKDALGISVASEVELEDGCHLNREHTTKVVTYINKVVD